MRRVSLLALAAAFAAPAAAQSVSTLTTGNTLLTVNAATPGTATSTRAITGIGAGQTLLGLDARPASPRVLYSTSSTGQLYAINPFTATATAVGAPITLPAGASAAAYDFNPTVDRLRVVTNTGANLRLNPNNGAVAGIDMPVAYVAGDVAAGANPVITGAAYTNNVPGATSTTMYVIDSGRGTLAIQGSIGGAPVSPNTGQLTTVGSLGVTTNNAVGFDISAQGQSLATLTNPTTGVTSLYSVNLTTGRATLIGALAGNGTATGLAFTAAPLASFTTNANAAAAGNAIDAFVGVPGPQQAQFYQAFDALGSNADRAAALQQFTPGAYTLLPDLLMRTAEFQQQVTLRYLRDYRAGGTGVEGQAGVADPGERKLGTWLVGRGGTGRYNGFGDRPQIAYSETGLAGGIDTRFGEKSVIGISGGYQVINPRLSDLAIRSSLRNWFAGGYGSFAAGPAFIDLFGSYGEGDMDLRRTVAFGPGTYQTGFGASGSSRTWVAGGNVGLSFNFAGFEFEPNVGLRYTDLLISRFNETIANVGSFGGITIEEQRYQSVLSNVGLRVGAAFEVGNATVRPEVRGSWRREWNEDGSRVIPYTLFGTTGGTLAYTTTPLGRDYATVGAGFTVSGPTSPLSFVADYQGDFIGGRELHTLTGGLRFTF